MQGRTPHSAPSRPTGDKGTASTGGSSSAVIDVATIVGSSSAAPSAGASSTSWWPAGTINSGADSTQWMPGPGGFMNFLQHPQFPPFTQRPYMPENFHFVGVPPNILQFSPPPAPYSKGTLSPSDPSDKVTNSEKKKQKAISEKKQKATIEIDEEDDDDRPGRKRKHWTHEEEVRLANAWLNNSNDPIGGNNKKNDKFWADVTAAYNSNSPTHAQRETNQLKVHWQRLKTAIGLFNGCWTTINKTYASGHSEDQMMDKALELYVSLYKKLFTLISWWRTLKNEPKWCAYIEQIEKEKDKSSVDDNPSDIRGTERPIGRDQAKAERRGKRKSTEPSEGIVLLVEKIDKMVEAHTASKAKVDKMLEVAKEQKE